jgi:hypothetical protein
VPVARVERDGVTAWDLLLDGSARFDLRITIILSPGLGLIAWLPYAPPVADGYRKTYQQLLQWNDELPFVKFGLDPDQRLTLSVEIPTAAVGREPLGLAIARILAVCDHLLDASAHWLWPDGSARPSAAGRVSRGEGLLRRYRAELAELLLAPATLGPGGPGGGKEPPDQLEAEGS